MLPWAFCTAALQANGTPVTDLAPLKGMKSLTKVNDLDLGATFLTDLREAMKANATARARELATKLVADWQDVPAMADVVKQAKEMLQAARGAAAAKD